MASSAARATKGFFLFLAAAFLLLAAFVMGLSGIFRASTGRLILAAAAFVLAVVLVRAGNAAIRGAGESEPEGEPIEAHHADP